jgi:SSS family solute:Na+ symporter
MYWLVLAGYFSILITAGLILKKKSLDFNQFFYAGRKLGSFLIFLTITASWFGAASTIATVEEGFDKGFGAIWLLGIPTMSTIIVFILINKRIRKTHFISLPHFLEKHYGQLVASLASLLIFFYMVILAASQFIAWGKFAAYFMGVNYELTVIIGAIIVIFYSYFGGYLSVVLTDGLQLLLLASSLIFLIGFLPPCQSCWKPGDFILNGDLNKNLLVTISFTLAWVISPIIWQRIASAKSKKSSRNGLVFSLVFFAILYSVIIIIAILLRQYQLSNLGEVIKSILPAGGGILVFIGMAAAIMSTADTAINIGALTLVKDVFKIKNPSKILISARTTTLLTGIIAIIIAIKIRSIIIALGLASEILAEGLFIPGMYALFFKKRRPWAGRLSLCSGGAYSVISFSTAYGLETPFPQWPYSLPLGLIIASLGFSVGLIIDKKKDLKQS